MNHIDVLLFPCGAIVKIKCGGIEGMITAQCIRFNRVTYEISYFYSGEQKLIWMHEDEFDTDTEKGKIGFK